MISNQQQGKEMVGNSRRWIEEQSRRIYEVTGMPFRTLKKVFGTAAVSVVVLVALCLAHLASESTYQRPCRFDRLLQLDRQDCRVGVLEGYDSERLARKAFPRAQIVGFKEFNDAFMALLANRIEGFVYCEHVLNIAMRAYPNRLKMIDEPLARMSSVAVVSDKCPNLVQRLNEFIRGYRKAGVYDEMFLRWCQSDEYVPMPPVPEPGGTNAVLRIGTSGSEEPSSFVDDAGEVVGFDVEFARRFAQFMRLKPEIVCRPDSVILDELAAGDLDLVVDNYSVDEIVGQKGVLVSNGYFDSDMKVLVKAGDDSALMLGSARLGYTKALIKDPRVRLFVVGFLSTLALTLSAAFFGLVFAVILRLIDDHVPSFLKTSISFVLETIQLLPPPVVLLMIGCAVLTTASPWVVAIAAFSFWLTAFVEPSMTGWRTAVPMIRTKLVELMQWTSIVGTIGICDLTLATDLVCGRTFAAFGPLLSVAAAYTLMNWIVVKIGSWIERKIA